MLDDFAERPVRGDNCGEENHQTIDAVHVGVRFSFSSRGGRKKKTKQDYYQKQTEALLADERKIFYDSSDFDQATADKEEQCCSLLLKHCARARKINSLTKPSLTTNIPKGFAHFYYLAVASCGSNRPKGAGTR